MPSAEYLFSGPCGGLNWVSELIPAMFMHSPSNCQESRGAFHRPRCCRCSCVHHSHAAAVVFVYMILVAAHYFDGAEVLEFPETLV